MRLLTHNFLQCHAKGCKAQSFLSLHSCTLEQLEVPVSVDFVTGILGRIDYPALLSVAANVPKQTRNF